MQHIMHFSLVWCWVLCLPCRHLVTWVGSVQYYSIDFSWNRMEGFFLHQEGIGDSLLDII